MRQLAESLWVIDHPFRLRGLDLGTRSTLVRLSGGGLFLHSPGPLSDADRKAVDAIGTVRCIVAPSKLHYFFVAENVRAFSEARIYGAPGVAKKLKDATVDEELAFRAPAVWEADLDQVEVKGAPYLGEFVFLHRASRTVLLTDLCFHVRESDSFLTRLFLRAVGAYGRFGPSRIARSTMRDKEAVRASVDRILAWDFDRVIVTHGEVLETGGKAAMRDAFAWLAG